MLPRRSSLFVGTLIALQCGAGLAVADAVRVRTLADGSRMIYNESSTQKARRVADRFVPVPHREIEELIEREALARGLSPRLVRAVVQVESGYNPRALSSKGAMGLMQLMPGTAAELRVADAWDPAQNVAGGTSYLRRMFDRFGDLTLALAAYNAGPTAVEKYGGIPPYRETIRYVDKVLSLLRGGSAPSDIHIAQAQLTARERSWQRRREAKAPAGKSVYVTRDANGRIVVTTSPPR